MSDFKRYEYVIAVAECGGVSLAAQKLGIAQPTLSRYIKKIEEELGLELFDRKELPLRPTSAGKCYIEAGKKLLYTELQLKKRIGEIRDRKNAVVRVGISPSRSPYMMPAIVSQFKAKRPEAKLIIEERKTEELAERLEAGELDIIISLFDKSTEKFEREELFFEDLLLAVKICDNAAASAEAVMLSTPLISVGHGQTMWRSLHSVAEKIGAPEAKIECQSIESALSLARCGLGATLVPSYIKDFGGERNDSLLFLPLPESQNAEKRRVALFWKKDQHLTCAERDFVLSVKEALATKNFKE